ncbi:putative disease resistance protein RGA4 [Gossypium arboreum]|nr:putative disease resistance protein RGA4 [Gossypium arboreum]XP_052876879.1 putative disease resistance protein RGA4 [Gossypium arboreum]XP_052876880.1 putative disease resistance protein RGA4 [Gossypium arboreum]XP_052876881.1 putative disease resistance protein RGA4 [Gossypium arboreum]
MAEAIAFDLAVELITKLSSFTLSQIRLCWNVKDDLDDLKSTVSTIKAVLLDAEQRSVTSHLVKDWLEKLKDVLYDADDLLDDFSTEALGKDLLGGNKLTKEVRLFFSSSNQFAYGLKMGRQIKAVKARLTSIGSEAKMFNLVERDRPMETSFMTKRRHQTHSFKDNIIGRDDDKAALLKLMLEFESEENVSIIPIVGLGGLGKTALAQFVYNDEMVKNHFELMMFVCVSDVFDVKIIVENMIKSATGEAPNQKLEMDQLQTQLRGKIGGKKYLLVLDDIWNEEWEEWVSLKELLVGGAKGSRIIVTTRSLRVAKITSKCQPYVLKGLSDDDAWSLFKEIAFEQRYADSTNAAFVEIGKHILEGCGGVPLVIRTIASTLSFKETEKEWRSFKDNEFTRICQNKGKILDTLKLSYDHLPSHLKHCFAYCRLYPKDHEIRVQTLVQFWIAQGFVKQLNSSQSLEEIGLGYFTDLVERSFFQEVGERYSWEGLTCKMHDLMHDLAESVSGTESSIVDSNEIAIQVGEKCRHISIDPSLIPLFKGKKLRTMLQFPNKRNHNMNEEIWDFMISNYRCLRVLELNGLDFKMIPRSICKLKHLRYLDLSGNLNIKSLPKSICKIQNLQALKLNLCWQLEELPKKIEKLVNLTHLSCSDCVSLTHMPRGIGKLTSLETLSMFVVDKDGSHDGADLSELSGLNNLRGELKITNLEFVKNAKEKFKAANLKEKQHLRLLVLVWNYDDDDKDDGNDDDDDDKSLEDLRPHPNLKELFIGGWRGDAKFPSWLSLLTNLAVIRIWGPSNFKQIPSFAQLLCLQKLSIVDLTELEYMDDNSPKGSQGERESFFPSLKSLCLENCPNMKSWWRKRSIDDDNEDDTTVIGTSTMAFPCLSSLEIVNCPLTSMPLYPSLDDDLRLVKSSSRPLKQTMKMNITSTTPSTSTSSLPLSKLKSFHVHKIEGLGTHMLDEYLKHFTGLKKLTIGDCKEVDLEGMQWEALKNLSHLEIINIPQLVSLPLGLQHLVQLKRLEIWNCSGLRSLFPVFQHLTFLEVLVVTNCKELELSAAGFQIFQDHTRLRSLSLENIPKCRHLPEWIQHLTNLQILSLVDWPNLTSLPDEMRCLTNLQQLNIHEVPQLEERCQKDIGADWYKIAHIPSVTDWSSAGYL